MAKLNIVTLPGRRLKDKTYSLYLSVYHKRKYAYITLPFKIERLSQFRNGRVSGFPGAEKMNKCLSQMFDKYLSRLEKINESTLEQLGVTQLKDYLTAIKTASETTFEDVVQAYISELNNTDRLRYSELLERGARYFKEFRNGDETPLSAFTPTLIDEYSVWLKTHHNLGITSQGMMLSRIRLVLNRAVRKQLVTYDISPFKGVYIPTSDPRDRSLCVESFNKIRRADIKYPRVRFARDLFLLSFYLGGLNLRDLLDADLRGDVLEYSRYKTRNTTRRKSVYRLGIPPEAREIIDRYIDPRTGRVQNPYRFSYQNLSRYITDRLVDLGVELNLPEHLVYYSARKTFAQFAFELGMPETVIDYCLGHSDRNRGVIRFYTKVLQKQADIVIRSVINYVDEPEKYENFLALKMRSMMGLL